MRKGKSPQRRSGAPQERPRRREESSHTADPGSPATAVATTTNISLTLKHFQRRRENSLVTGEAKRLYLRVGDEVNHLRHEEWGIGVVMEVMTSSVPGGTCLVRVRFHDGQLRCFNNDLENEACCYYFGVRRYWNPTHGVDAIGAKFFGRG